MPSGTPASSFHTGEGEGESVTGAPVEVPPRVASVACSNGHAKGRDRNFAASLSFFVLGTGAGAPFPLGAVVGGVAAVGEVGVDGVGALSSVRPVQATGTNDASDSESRGSSA